MDVDVVVVSYNSSSHLRGCLDVLIGVPGVHPVVVDSASDDGSLDSVADLPVTRIPLNVNRGFAHGCNTGWRLGTAPFVLFLNPDARIDAASLELLIHAVEADPAVGAAAPKIVGSDGSLDFSLRRFPRLRSTFAGALFLHRVFPLASWSDELVRDPALYQHPWSPEWVSGACMLVRRSVLERVGGFDESFFLYCEDLDLCRRIRDAGLRIRFEPRATAVHEGGASAPRATLLPVLASSRVRYAQKHQRSVVAVLERTGVALGELTHTVVTRGGGPARRGHLRSFLRACSPPYRRQRARA
jgi:hypothetical protein